LRGHGSHGPCIPGSSVPIAILDLFVWCLVLLCSLPTCDARLKRFYMVLHLWSGMKDISRVQKMQTQISSS
jgi:hypothetical protein